MCEQNKGVPAMAQFNVGTTDPEQLRRVAVWRDNPAWNEFFGRYDPFVRYLCSRYGLDSASADELCQRVWVELAQRMTAYRYDPGGCFRGWLRRLCHHRAIDLLRERRNRSFHPLLEHDLTDEGRGSRSVLGGEPNDDEAEAGKLPLFREAREAQEAVQRNVKPVRWEVFWRVVIEGESIGETAATLGLKYATVYAGVNHVAELLKAEGQRRRGRLGLDCPPNTYGG
jgi:RNA polymerase sigma factor (sigma-70 family)